MPFRIPGPIQGIMNDADEAGRGLLSKAAVVSQAMLLGAQRTASLGEACMLPVFVVSKSDWAGRKILSHYLTGGGIKLTITNDPKWTDYMAESGLSGQITTELNAILAPQMRNLKAGQTITIPKRSFHGDIDNGEDMVGYQYLHGSNKDVGDCEFSASLKVESIDERKTEAKIQGEIIIQWHDIIDPNPQYKTDSLKSIYAEVCTFGRAAAYELHIEWSEKHNYVWSFRSNSLGLGAP